VNNEFGLVLTLATGTAEHEAALTMLSRLKGLTGSP
jgi:hypothetical protein